MHATQCPTVIISCEWEGLISVQHKRALSENDSASNVEMLRNSYTIVKVSMAQVSYLLPYSKHIAYWRVIVVDLCLDVKRFILGPFVHFDRYLECFQQRTQV